MNCSIYCMNLVSLPFKSILYRKRRVMRHCVAVLFGMERKGKEDFFTQVFECRIKRLSLQSDWRG